MSYFTDIFAHFYALVYRFLKWLELTFYYTFSYPVEKKVQRQLESLGFVLHFTETGEKSDVEKVRKRSKYEPLIDMKINRKRKLFCGIATTFGLALGEGFMDGDWDCDPDLAPELTRRAFRSKTHMVFYTPWNRMLLNMYFRLCNMQTEKRAWEVGRRHYDLGNELFQSFLDPYMTYTCGYWKTATNLNDAQIDKMDLIARKLNLKPGMRVLDIGCGWGGLCKFLAERYGVKCVGITISKEGARYAREFCKGLEVEIILQDYRSLEGEFDRIVSVGMFEHVGIDNQKIFFKTVHRCLKDDGIFLLHTIGRSHLTTPRVDVFTHKYIFPNGSIPHHSDIAQGITGMFVLEDWHNFGPDYAKTLDAWWINFQKNWPKIADKYDDRFFRMWQAYLRTANGLFSSTALQLFQIVLSKDGLDCYRAAR